MSAMFPGRLVEDLAAGRIIPYLGPEVLALAPDTAVPSSPETLVERITAKVTVPHKIRKNLTAASASINIGAGSAIYL